MKKLLFLLVYTLAATAIFAQLNEKVGIGTRLRLDSSKGYTLPLILEVVPDGSAKQAGLLAGDFILKVNEQSTKNMALDKIVALIVGKEGTAVKLKIERKGILKDYTVKRVNYTYTSIFYETADKDNSFCSAITKLMNDAAYDFASSMDTVGAKLSNGNYTCKIPVPGAESTEISVSFTASCKIIAGRFASINEANAAAATFIEKLKNCFPDYYYETETDKDGGRVTNIGRLISNGYYGPVLGLFVIFDKTAQKYDLTLRIQGGKRPVYYHINLTAKNTPYAKSLRIIYDDIKNDFSHVKGTKHEPESKLFGSTWYEVKPLPSGAISCRWADGLMGFGADNCSCDFYKGKSREEAVAIFKRLFEDTKSAFGKGFVYSDFKSDWDMNISKNVQSMVTFAEKKAHQYESDLPKIVLVFEKYKNDTYGVRMLFYKYGF